MNALLEVVAPVALLVLAGIAAARFGVVDAPGVKATSSLAFALFLPALLFRSLATRDFATLDPTVPIAYFAGSLPLYLGVWFLLRRAGLGNARATIRGLGAVFAEHRHARDSAGKARVWRSRPGRVADRRDGPHARPAGGGQRAAGRR
ncbi:MAG: hypothetical protein R3E48_16825 [Burkholderiaceae bacterium]